MAKILVSPSGAKEIEISYPFLWTLMLGPFYFAYHRAWLHSVISAILAIPTSGISTIIYPFFAEKIIMNNYKSMGWTIKGTGDKAGEKDVGTNITDMPEYKK